MDSEVSNTSEAAAEILKYIEQRFKACGTNAQLLLLDAWKEAKRFATPREKWKKRRAQTENPEAFIVRVWGDLIPRYGLTTADIRKADLGLYVAWNNWKRFNESELAIPTKSEINTKLGKKIETTVEKDFNAHRSRKLHHRRRHARTVEARA